MDEDFNVCANCTNAFEARCKGYQRHPLGKKISGTEHTVFSALQSVVPTSTLTPAKARCGRYLCTDCFNLLCTIVRQRDAYAQFMQKGKMSSYVTRKRKLCSPMKTPRKVKSIRCFSPGKSMGSQKTLQHKPLNAVAKLFQNYDYRRGINLLYKKPSGKKAIHTLLSKVVHKEMSSLKKAQTVLRGKTSLEALETFSWDTVLEDISRDAPLFCTLLATAITNPKCQDAMLNGRKNIKPGLGLVIAVLLHLRFPCQYRLVQDIMSIELWRGGCRRSVMSALSKMGVCFGIGATLKLLDRVR